MTTPVRIAALHVVPNRDIDIFNAFMKCNSPYKHFYFHTTKQATVLQEPKHNLILCTDIYALNSPIVFERKHKVSSNGVTIVLLAPETMLATVLDTSFDIYIESVQPGDEKEWLIELARLEDAVNKTEYRPIVADDGSHVTHEMLTYDVIDGILEHIEMLKQKEVIHRYNSLRYSVPNSRRNAIRHNFARYLAGIVTPAEFRAMCNANEVALGHLDEIDAFIKQNPNYLKGFRTLLDLIKLGQVDHRVVQSISEEFKIPIFELNYFGVKANEA